MGNLFDHVFIIDLEERAAEDSDWEALSLLVNHCNSFTVSGEVFFNSSAVAIRGKRDVSRFVAEFDAEQLQKKPFFYQVASAWFIFVNMEFDCGVYPGSLLSEFLTMHEDISPSTNVETASAIHAYPGWDNSTCDFVPYSYSEYQDYTLETSKISPSDLFDQNNDILANFIKTGIYPEPIDDCQSSQICTEYSTSYETHNYEALQNVTFDEHEQNPSLEAEFGQVPELKIADLPELKTADLPELQTADLPELQTADLPELQTADLPELQTADLPELQAADSPEVQTADSPEVQTADLPELQTADLPELQTADLPELQTADLPELQIADLPELQTADLPELRVESSQEQEPILNLNDLNDPYSGLAIDENKVSIKFSVSKYKKIKSRYYRQKTKLASLRFRRSKMPSREDLIERANILSSVLAARSLFRYSEPRQEPCVVKKRAKKYCNCPCVCDNH